MLSISYSLRFIAIIFASSVFFLTLSPDDIEYILRSLHFPRDLIFAFVTAVRFVPVMMLDMQQIMDAQKARGLELDKGSILKRIKNLIPILIPLVISAIIRSEEMAEAMETRAYGCCRNPESYIKYTFSKKDFVSLILSSSIFASLTYLFV
jgi:energy-coupling factor transport system permease protein